MASASAHKPTVMLVFDISTLVNRSPDKIGSMGVDFVGKLMTQMNVVPSVVSKYTLTERRQNIISAFFSRIKPNSVTTFNVPVAYNTNPSELYTKETLLNLYRQYTNSLIHTPVYFFGRDIDSVNRMRPHVTESFHITTESDWDTALESIQRTLSAASLGAPASLGGGAAAPPPLNLSGPDTPYNDLPFGGKMYNTPVVYVKTPTTPYGGRRKTKRNLRKRRQTKGKRTLKK
jgi:hypothetical protein